MNQCPHCTKRVVVTFEGPQAWCMGCGRLYWLNPDGSVRGTQVPSIIAAHEVCHDLNGEVGPTEFAEGCAAKQRELFGCAPDRDARLLLEERISRMEGDGLRPVFERKCWGSVCHVFDGVVATSHLLVNAGYQCSLHWHDRRTNYFFVVAGLIEIELHPRDAAGEVRVVTLEPGGSCTVAPGVVHRFRVFESGVMVEVYWCEDGSPVALDDIQRIVPGGPIA